MPPLKTGQNPDEEPVGLLFTAKYRGKNITDYNSLVSFYPEFSLYWSRCGKGPGIQLDP